MEVKELSRFYVFGLSLMQQMILIGAVGLILTGIYEYFF